MTTPILCSISDRSTNSPGRGTWCKIVTGWLER